MTTSDLNIVLKWSDDLKSYDMKDFKLYKAELHKKNKIHLKDMTAFIDKISTVTYFNPREIKDWTEGETKCLLTIATINFLSLLTIFGILQDSVLFWLVWFNFGILVICFPMIYCQKQRAWNKLK